MKRPVVLITGASRTIGIGAAIARRLAVDGWDVAVTYWQPYDERMPWGSIENEPDLLLDELGASGASTLAVPADLTDPDTPALVFDQVNRELGPVRALVLSHAESVDGDIRGTTVESFDRHFAVNARASWLLLRAFAQQFVDPRGTGRIVALTSDHTAWNLAYGASKGALDRIVLAAAAEFADLGVTANVINPGATDSGWMSDELMQQVAHHTLAGRVGQPVDAANLVAFLCGPEGGWINGQLLYSDGGRSPN